MMNEKTYFYDGRKFTKKELHDKFYFYDGRKFTKKELHDKFDKIESENKLGTRFKTTLKMIEGKDVLDVGCAAGHLTRHIAKKGFRVHGIDVLEDSIQIAEEFNKFPNTTYEVRDLITNPLPSESFDCITFLETIEHVENPAGFLKEFNRILRPNGVLIISTPNATSLKNILYALSYKRKEKREKIINEISQTDRARDRPRQNKRALIG